MKERSERNFSERNDDEARKYLHKLDIPIQSQTSKIAAEGTGPVKFGGKEGSKHTNTNHRAQSYFRDKNSNGVEAWTSNPNNPNKRIPAVKGNIGEPYKTYSHTMKVPEHLWAKGIPVDIFRKLKNEAADFKGFRSSLKDRDLRNLPRYGLGNLSKDGIPKFVKAGLGNLSKDGIPKFDKAGLGNLTKDGIPKFVKAGLGNLTKDGIPKFVKAGLGNLTKDHFPHQKTTDGVKKNPHDGLQNHHEGQDSKNGNPEEAKVWDRKVNTLRTFLNFMKSKKLASQAILTFKMYDVKLTYAQFSSKLMEVLIYGLKLGYNLNKTKQKFHSIIRSWSKNVQDDVRNKSKQILTQYPVEFY